MSSTSNQHTPGIKASQALRVRQPFKSPLRSPGVEGTALKPSSLVNKSPSLLRRQITVPKSELSPSLQQKVSKTNDNEELCSDKDIQSHSGNISVTPKRPSMVTCSGGSSMLRKVGPRQISSNFKSPFGKAASEQISSKQEEFEQLIKQEKELDAEISSLKSEGLEVEELQGHIKNLHRYNDIKDAAQLVMGKLAELEGVTVKEMHERYEVNGLD